MTACGWCETVGACSESVNTQRGFVPVCGPSCADEWWTVEQFGWSEDYA